MKITLSWNFDATEAERALIQEWENDIHAKLDGSEFENITATIEKDEDGELALQLVGPNDDVLVKALNILTHQ